MVRKVPSAHPAGEMTVQEAMRGGGWKTLSSTGINLCCWVGHGRLLFSATDERWRMRTVSSSPRRLLVPHGQNEWSFAFFFFKKRGGGEIKICTVMEWRWNYSLCQIINELEALSWIKQEFEQEKFMLRIVNLGHDSYCRCVATYHQAKWGKELSFYTFGQWMIQASEWGRFNCT